MRRLAGVVLVAVAVVGCGDSKDKEPTAKESCEAAYEKGLGNASTSDRDSWIADCVAETEALNRDD